MTTTWTNEDVLRHPIFRNTDLKRIQEAVKCKNTHRDVFHVWIGSKKRIRTHFHIANVNTLCGFSSRLDETPLASHCTPSEQPLRPHSPAPWTLPSFTSFKQITRACYQQDREKTPRKRLNVSIDNNCNTRGVVAVI